MAGYSGLRSAAYRQQSYHWCIPVRQQRDGNDMGEALKANVGPLLQKCEEKDVFSANETALFYPM